MRKSITGTVEPSRAMNTVPLLISHEQDEPQIFAAVPRIFRKIETYKKSYRSGIFSYRIKKGLKSDFLSVTIYKSFNLWGIET